MSRRLRAPSASTSRKPALIVDKSTVPVGTADMVRGVDPGRTRPAAGCTPSFDVVSNPEFLKEGAAIDDFMKPDRIIVGAENPDSIELMRQLYHPFNRNHNRIIVMDTRSAELTKYAANAMLATKISFMNEIANIAERTGANIESVRIGIGSDSRIGYNFIYAGIGYGGSCFPKDVRALENTALNYDYDAQLLAADRGGQPAPETRPAGQDPRSLRWQRGRQDVRALGTGLQTEDRRCPRRAEPCDHRGSLGTRAPGSGPSIRKRWTRRRVLLRRTGRSSSSATPATKR